MIRRLLASVVVAASLLLPAVASAQIVPCSGVDIVNNQGVPTCQACDLVALLNNVLAWLVAVLAIIAAIFFVYAGWTLVTSAGNVSAKESAKRTITNTFIGFVIVLAAWLAVDLGMKMLLSGGAGTLTAVTPGFGPWNSVQCAEQPQSLIIQPGVSLGSAGGSQLTENCSITFTGPPPVFDCTPQETACTTGGGTATIDTSNPTAHRVVCDYPASAYTGSCDLLPSGNPCDPTDPRMVAEFGPRADEASRICNKESGGAPINSGADLCCGTDGSCAGDPSFSGGYFQINVLAHASDLQAAGAPGCTTGFYTPNGSGIQGTCVNPCSSNPNICCGWSCEITNTTVFEACMAAARNPDYNFQVAGDLFTSRGFQPWANSANRCSIPY